VLSLISPLGKYYDTTHMIQDTSLFAYAQATQNLGAKQKQALDALRFFPDATNAEIVAHMKWPMNRITPRCLELRNMGLILEGSPPDV
jgi:hypothetical protein